MATYCEENEDGISLGNDSCSSGDFEALTSARDAYNDFQTEFHKRYYFGGAGHKRRMTYNRSMSEADLTWEELFNMHMEFRPVSIFSARFSDDNSTLAVPTVELAYPLYDIHFMTYFEYEECLTDKIFNNGYLSDFDRLAKEAESVGAARNQNMQNENEQFHKLYYFEESGSAFERMSHDHSHSNWEEFVVYMLCMERKPVPIFTASNLPQKYTLCTQYADVDMQPRYECEVIPWSTEDSLHTYFTFEFVEDVVTIPVSDSIDDVTPASFMSEDSITIVATLSYQVAFTESNSIIYTHCTSEDDEMTVTKQNDLEDDDEIFTTPLTNNLMCHFEFEDDIEIYHTRNASEDYQDSFEDDIYDDEIVSNSLLAHCISKEDNICSSDQHWSANSTAAYCNDSGRLNPLCNYTKSEIRKMIESGDRYDWSLCDHTTNCTSSFSDYGPPYAHSHSTYHTNYTSNLSDYTPPYAHSHNNYTQGSYAYNNGTLGYSVQSSSCSIS